MTPSHNSSRADLAIKKFLNVPLLIHGGTLNTILNVIGARPGEAVLLDPNVGLHMPGQEAGQSSQQHPAAIGIAVIPIRGVLVFEPDEILSFFGFEQTTYADILEDFQAAEADPAIQAIVFDCHSPGGDVAGCFDLVDEIYQARGTKPVYAVVHEMAFSGCYAIASAADKVYLSRTGGAGSVGVIMEHADQSKWDADIGVKYTPIFAGARKNDFTPHEPLSDEARTIAQDMVNATYDLFVKTVARNRGITPQAVRATEAGLFWGKQAVDAGFADAVMSWDQAIGTVLKKHVKGGKDMNVKAIFEGLKAFFKPEATEAEVTAALGSIPADAVAVGSPAPAAAAAPAIPAPPADLEKIKTETRAGIYADVKMIADICGLAGMEKMIPALVQEGVSPDTARTKILEAKAAETEKINIRSTTGPLSSGEVNPLVADAKKRADKTAHK